MDDIDWLNAILAEANIPPITVDRSLQTEDDSSFIDELKARFTTN